eukprot:scaffold100207_cov40-Attheya_sp.AAC.1
MGKQVLFAITPDVRIDAQIMINNLLPMFRYKYGDNIARCFEPSAVAALAELTWDPDTCRVTSPSDNVIDAQETEDAALGHTTRTNASDSTLATTDTTKDKVERLVARLRRMATKRGCWDSDDESACTTLSKLENIDYIQGKLALMDDDEGKDKDDDSSGDEKSNEDNNSDPSKDTTAGTYETDATMEDVNGAEAGATGTQESSSTSSNTTSKEESGEKTSSQAAAATAPKASKSTPPSTSADTAGSTTSSTDKSPREPTPGATKEDALSVSESPSSSDESQAASAQAPSESSSSLEEFDAMMEKAKAKLQKTRGKGTQKGR